MSSTSSIHSARDPSDLQTPPPPPPPPQLKPSIILPPVVRKRKSPPSDTAFISDESDALKLFDELIAECRTPEATFLYLLDRYSIDMNVLHRVGVKRLKSSFSRVTYRAIAGVFGLDPSDTDLLDIPQFEMRRSWLPLAVVRGICYDVEVADVQYGQMITHNNEEARSRYIAAVFNRVIYLFGRKIVNRPEELLEGEVTDRRRIEHQFIAFGATVVLFIEVKRDLLGGKARVDQIAQVLAEADACDYRNSSSSLWVPMLGVLCDGAHFEFFVYDSSTRSFALSERMKGLEQFQSDVEFLRSIKRTAEYMYDMFLAGYINGLRAFLDRSNKTATRQDRKRTSTDKWATSLRFAECALEHARHAADLAKEGKPDDAEETARKAVELLDRSVEEAPGRRVKDGVSFMDAWVDEEMKFW